MLYSRIFAGVGIVGALAASVVAMTGDGGGGGGGGSNCLANQYPVYNDQGQLTGACNRCPQYATAAAGSYTCSCPAVSGTTPGRRLTSDCKLLCSVAAADAPYARLWDPPNPLASSPVQPGSHGQREWPSHPLRLS